MEGEQFRLCDPDRVGLDALVAGVVDYALSHHEEEPEQGFLNLLMIAPAWRSKGLGQAVVAQIEQMVWQQPGVRFFRSVVQVDNPGRSPFGSGWALRG